MVNGEKKNKCVETAGKERWKKMVKWFFKTEIGRIVDN